MYIVIEMNVELDRLLCLVDGKITAYRMQTGDKDPLTEELKELQFKIQELWTKNKENKGEVRKV